MITNNIQDVQKIGLKCFIRCSTCSSKTCRSIAGLEKADPKPLHIYKK
jgi:hypothetical protein